MKPVLLDLIERLLHADCVSGPDSTLVLFHPFFLRSHAAARSEWLRWTARASRTRELAAHLTEENLLNWSKMNSFEGAWLDEKDMLIEMLSQVGKNIYIKLKYRLFIVA